MEKSSCRKRSFRVVYSDEEMGSAGQKHNRISSSEKDVESACDSDPKLNRTINPSQQSDHYEEDGFSGDWEPEYVSDPKLNNTNPSQQSDHYEEDGFSGDWEPEYDSDPKLNNTNPSQQSDHYEEDGFSGDWEPEYDFDPKLNNANPSQQSDYAAERFSGDWEPESDYRRCSPSGPYYDNTSAKKKKNCNEGEIHSDSINQNAEPAKRNLLFVKTPGFRYKAEQQLGELDAAEPLIRAAWAGAFTVFNGQNTSTTFQGINACLSTKACPAACVVVEQMPPSVQWEKLPRSCVWPKPFQESPVGGPTPNDIAVFFFPSLTKHAAAYDSLLFDLISDDLALRTSVLGSELLLFTSIELPPPSRRFQGKLFLWGVFRGEQPQL